MRVSTRPIVAGTTEHTAPANRVYFPALDGLRAIAFLMVLLEHYSSIPWGWSGVNVFFVLSGFLITGILWDTRDSPRRARDFYMRRTLRIFPLYYGIFIALLITTPVFHWAWTRRWIAWPLYAGNFLSFVGRGGGLTSAQQAVADAQLRSRSHGTLLYLGHFWSLCVEEQFYLFWPWIVFAMRSRRKLIALCAIVVIISPILRVGAYHYAPAWMLKEGLTYRLTPFQLDSLLLGGLLALLWRGADRAMLYRLARIASVLCSAFLLASVVWIAASFWGQIGEYRYPTWYLTWGLSFIDVFSGALIICALHPGSVVYRVLHWRPLRALGRVSYGAYVFHDIFHKTIEGNVHKLAAHSHLIAREEKKLLLVTAFAVTVILASTSYRFFESPFLELKSRLSSGPARTPEQVTAT